MLPNDHNNPPSPVELFAEQIASITSQVDVFGDINEDNAGAANDLIKRAGQIAKEIDQKRKNEKQPHLDAGREIDGTYNPLKEKAASSVTPLKKALAAHISEQKRIAEQARREAEEKARKEAARLQALADDPLIGDQVQEQAKEAMTEFKDARIAEKQAANVKGSAGFRAAGVKTKRFAKVTNSRELVRHYANHPDVVALCERLANADIRAAKGAPVVIGGVEVETEEVLA
ncbi:hypothetical protein [uncultured Planktomarina sp.]|uniref:hypothetical protein n=1 Tax=uncultured Planktomarina sp. TaxID=1538529 RepID=UPI0032609445